MIKLPGLQRIHARKHAGRPTRKFRSTLSLESLEDRCVPTTFKVLNTLDDGADSLRQAIVSANNNPGPDLITFQIDTGAQQITLLTPLPAITDPVTIDGSSQQGPQGKPLILLNGASIPAEVVATGLEIDTTDSLVKSLIVSGFSTGITVGGFGSTGVTGNQIESCYLGTDATGMAALGNGNGIRVASDAHNNTIGGVGLGNVISGNSDRGLVITDAGTSANVVEGNLIGVAADGLTALGNGRGLVLAGGAANNQIGGTAAGMGNVISGNVDFGVTLSDAGTTGNVFQGNLIGTDASDTQAVPNTGEGMLITADGNKVGGTDPGAGNVISGNSNPDGANGLSIQGNANIVQGNWIGTDKGVTLNLGNFGYGVDLRPGSHNNIIGGTAAGAGNLIAFNGEGGVRVREQLEVGSSQNTIRGNRIFQNQGLGINLAGGVEDANAVTANDALDADSGPNDLQNYPTLTSARPIPLLRDRDRHTAKCAASATYTIDFYASGLADPSGFGEGQVYLGSVDVTTNPDGQGSFTAILPPVELGLNVITATATDANGSTSEFSATLALVRNDASLTINGNMLTAVANQALSTTVATFTSTDANAPASSFTATILWGDGTSSTGTVTANAAGGFNVAGSHAYTTAGTFTATLQLVGLDNKQATATFSVDVATGGTPDQRFITRLYQDLLGRAAEQGGLNFWSGLLANGTSRGNVVLGIEGSQEYQTKLVTNVYMTYLHRSPNPGELASGLAAVRAGTSIEGLATPILASDEYIRTRGGNTTDGYLTALFQDLLGRPIEEAARQNFSALLAADQPRASIVLIIFNSNEFADKVVDAIFSTYLGRHADPGGLQFWAGVKKAGTLDQVILAAILGDTSFHEYYDKATG